MFLVFHLEDGTTNAVPVNPASTVRVQTWRPPTFAIDGASPPVLVEDQTLSLQGVARVTLEHGEPDGANVLTQAGSGELELLSDAEAAALDADFEPVPMPWELEEAANG